MLCEVSDTRHAAVFLQDACYQHQYIRSRDLSAIVERPERLRAVTIGLSAAIARLELVVPTKQHINTRGDEDPDDLVAAMNRMNLILDHESPISIIQSHASVDILANPAVKFVHGDVDGDVYLENLKQWAEDSRNKIHKGESEIPSGLAQGDLYLCPESIAAIQGALGTVCEAVDVVISTSRNATKQPMAGTPNMSVNPPAHRAFVAVRPPGHHCGEDSPAGFCFVNNVAVGAAHAHLQHGINRVVILDIDLHHGNGTQSITWQINEETYRQTLESEGGSPNAKSGPQIYYGSIHDILSYPCEDGKPNLIQAASVSLHKSHGQYIENIHLQTYTSEIHFWDVLYKEQYSKILRKAEEFLDGTGGPGDDVMVFISCGMDACEHEYESMSRHNRKVPTSFYYRFARDVCAFSDRYACGRVVSVLEGGYSNRALISGTMAHLAGLTDDSPSGGKVDESWWDVDNLAKLEKATKKRRGGRPSLNNNVVEPWLERALTIYSSLDTTYTRATSPSTTRGTTLPPTSMTLRERKPKSVSPVPSPSAKRGKTAGGSEGEVKVLVPLAKANSVTSSSSNSTDDDLGLNKGPKKLPRVILRLGPEPS
ncbi:histone deacetylase complex protein [Collybia nuda]|uniref:Histone deacetylase complex protein n=1 Tax=Collybia nuda TaxID=64659 RepID=A0A9P5YAZ4_9AGAR|nr:histone deacetylase complex protein [Collybia nuda]